MDALNSIDVDQLQSIDVDQLKPAFELAGLQADAGLPWNGDRRAMNRARRHAVIDARRLQNALEHVGELPPAKSALHLVTFKKYSLWHIVAATIALAAPARIRYLAIATLGFSKANVEGLLESLNRGEVDRADFLYSVYFKSHEREICQRLAHELTTRGHRIAACLQHAKILLMELTDGRKFAVESSANLRSCSSIEQITIYHDAELFDFHRGWIDDELSAADAKEKAKAAREATAKQPKRRARSKRAKASH